MEEMSTFSFKKGMAQIESSPLYRHPSAFFWKKSLSLRNQFCEAVVNVGYLSWDQMIEASCRYCIGSSKLGGVIFWQIDHEGRVHDGKVMYYLPDCHRNKSKEAHPTWISSLLARRHPFYKSGTSSHCFFGLHLLCRSPKPICVVESEKTAFILSEIYPQCIWLATGGLGEVQPDKFRPLRGHRIVMFPDTDPDGIAFKRWTEAANVVMQSVFWEDSPPIRVSPILELHATLEQKRRKIDLVDFLFSSYDQ